MHNLSGALDTQQTCNVASLFIGESIYDQKPPNPKQIDTNGFLTDSGRICHVK